MTRQNLTQSNQTFCPSCSSEFRGDYCSVCGEQRLTPELRSMKQILKDVFEEFTSVDSKLIKTLKVFLLYPGRYERNFHDGRRVNYLKPITLFLLINVIFVFLSPITDFYVSFIDQMTLQPYSPWVQPWVHSYIEHININQQTFANAYDQLVTLLARSLIILQVPFFAVFISVIYRNKNYFPGDYLIYSLNLHSWWMLWIVFAQIPASLFFLIAPGITEDVAFKFYLIILELGLVAYTVFSAMTMFSLSWKQVFWRVPLVLLAYQISHYLFRLAQLIITLLVVEV